MVIFIKRSFIFALTLISVFYLLNLFQTHFNTEPEHYKKQYSAAIKSLPEIDGVIIGTSHATHSIKPTILDESGITFYNFALNGANPKFYYKWYNEIYLLNNNAPSYCLFAVDYFMFDTVWLSRRFEQDSEYFPSHVFYRELTKPKSNIDKLIINRFPLFKYRSQIKESLKFEHGNSFFNIANYDRGYISYLIPFNNKHFVPTLKYTIDSTQVEYFKSILIKMLNKNVHIYFVMTPEYGIEIKEYQKMQSLKIIQQLAKEYNIQFLNYNVELRSSLNQNITFYSDWGHMNNLGADAFSKKLANELKERIKKNSLQLE